MKNIALQVLKCLKVCGILIMINFLIAIVICGLIIKDYNRFYDILFYISIVYFAIGGLGVIDMRRRTSVGIRNYKWIVDMRKRKDASTYFSFIMTLTGLLTLIISTIMIKVQY